MASSARPSFSRTLPLCTTGTPCSHMLVFAAQAIETALALQQGIKFTLMMCVFDSKVLVLRRPTSHHSELPAQQATKASTEQAASTVRCRGVA